jgi:hypothetical protein
VQTPAQPARPARDDARQVLRRRADPRTYGASSTRCSHSPPASSTSLGRHRVSLSAAWRADRRHPVRDPVPRLGAHAVAGGRTHR